MWSADYKNLGARSLVYLAGLLALLACSEDKPVGAINLTLIQPTPQHCVYNIAPTPVITLTSLSRMIGSLGGVVYNNQNVDADPNTLANASGFQSLDVQFSHWGDTYAPLDMTSLFGASLYYAVERGFLLFKGLDPVNADMSKLVPNIAQTLIVKDVKGTPPHKKVQTETHDNAEYYAKRVTQPDGSTLVRNYFFSYPTDKIKAIPLGVNLGIMIHEYTHFVFHYLFYEPGILANLSTDGDATLNTLSAMDEGNADYFGFLAAGDPGFFLCSYPDQNRDLAVYKPFTDSIVASINSGVDYDSHEGGASWASIQYKIGAVVGFQVNGQALIKTMANLIQCGGGNGGGTLSLSFAKIASCHVNWLSSMASSSAASSAQQIYQNALAPFGGTQ